MSRAVETSADVLGGSLPLPTAGPIDMPSVALATRPVMRRVWARCRRPSPPVAAGPSGSDAWLRSSSQPAARRPDRPVRRPSARPSAHRSLRSLWRSPPGPVPLPPPSRAPASSAIDSWRRSTASATLARWRLHRTRYGSPATSPPRWSASTRQAMRSWIAIRSTAPPVGSRSAMTVGSGSPCWGQERSWRSIR